VSTSRARCSWRSARFQPPAGTERGEYVAALGRGPEGAPAAGERNAGLSVTRLTVTGG